VIGEPRRGLTCHERAPLSGLGRRARARRRRAPPREPDEEFLMPPTADPLALDPLTPLPAARDPRWFIPAHAAGSSRAASPGRAPEQHTNRGITCAPPGP